MIEIRVRAHLDLGREVLALEIGGKRGGHLGEGRDARERAGHRPGLAIEQIDKPGAIETGMTREAFSDPAIRAVWAKKAALRRLGTPIDMARAALLLASDEADFVTGHGLVADGGLTLRT